jgi:hypothetical protein
MAEGGGNGGWGGGQEWPAKPWVDKAAATVQTRSARRRCCSDRVADEWAHAVLDFSELSKLAKTWKLKMDALPYFTNSQFLYVARLGHYEQFSQLCLHPILNRIRVKNPKTDSKFEF